MFEQIMNILVFFSIYLFIFVLYMIMPRVSKKGIVFGIRIPIDHLGDTQLKKIHDKYIGNLIILGALYFPSFLVLMYIYFNNYIIFIYLFVLLVFQAVIYYISYSKVKSYKNQMGWNKTCKQIVIIDTCFRNKMDKPLLVSALWFVFPVCLVIINLIIGSRSYYKLPQLTPVHWNILGRVDSFTIKSTALIYTVPLNQGILILSLFIVYKIIGWSKQEIDAESPKESAKKNRSFRFIWSKFIVFINFMLSIIYTFYTLLLFQIVKPTPAIISSLGIFQMLLVVLGILLVVIKTAQGERILMINKEKINDKGNLNKNDDMFWKFGIFYFNRKDPTVFIEKRFGIGWTINFASIPGIIMAISLILFIILTIILSI